MAERTGPIRYGQSVDEDDRFVRQIEPIDVSGSRNPEMIEREIARTREELGETVDAIQERLSPHYIKHQMTESIRDTARGAGNSMMETMKENPIPTLIAGLSVGWLVRRAARNSSVESHRYRGEYDRDYGYGYGYGPGYRSDENWDRPVSGLRSDQLRDRAEGMAENVRGRAEHMTEQVRDTAGNVTHEVRERVEDFGERVRDYSGRIEHGARRRASQAEQFMYENPVAAGALALAAGAIVGVAVPGTHFEDEMMGERKERMMEMAKEKASETMEKVEHVAEKTATQARDTAREEARSEGLTH